MTWVLWSLGLMLALLAVDRIATLAEGRGLIYWRKRKPSASGRSGVMGDLMTALQPNRQVMQQEFDHLDVLRDEIQSDQPGTPRSWVDLSGGKAWTAPHQGQ